MSHISTIEVRVKDLAALETVAESLGLEFREGQKTYKWYGRWVGGGVLPKGFEVKDCGKCDHALSVKGNPGAYEVGVCKAKDGTDGYILMWDFWSGGYGLEKAVGADGQKLIQGYQREVAVKRLRAQGWRFSEETSEDGTITIRARQ